MGGGSVRGMETMHSSLGRDYTYVIYNSDGIKEHSFPGNQDAEAIAECLKYCSDNKLEDCEFFVMRPYSDDWEYLDSQNKHGNLS